MDQKPDSIREVIPAQPSQGYTYNLLNYYLGLPEQEIDKIWGGIQDLTQENDLDKWKQKLEMIANDFRYSSCFALMRLIAADHSDAAVPGTLPFPSPTMQDAQQLTEEQHVFYEKLLCRRAAQKIAHDWASLANDPQNQKWFLQETTYDAANLIYKAMTPRSHANNTLLTREEALKLAHYLDFTLEQTQWWLLRIFDTDEALRGKCLHDLVDAYGFLNHASVWEVRELYQSCQKKVRSAAKKAGPSGKKSRTAREQTQDAGTFEQLVNHWPTEKKAREKEFLKWLKARAAVLDTPSRTALRVYRNLAVKTFQISQTSKTQDDLCKALLNVLQAPDEFPEAAALHDADLPAAQNRCSALARDLLDWNCTLNNLEANRVRCWHVPSLNRTTGKISSVQPDRSRVENLLNGSAVPDKNDVLYLLWACCNGFWQTQQDVPMTQSTLLLRVNDFITLAKTALSEAALPAFYPPHLTEWTMLTAIVYSGKKDDELPAYYYELLLDAARPRRNRVHDGQYGGLK